MDKPTSPSPSDTAKRIMGIKMSHARMRMDDYLISDWGYPREVQLSHARYLQDKYLASDWGPMNESEEKYELESGPHLADYFYDAVRANDKKHYLYPYDRDEFSKMKLFKINGLDAGFAIKPDGDVVSVHNNSTTRGVGGFLVRSAKKNGGTKLDHYDGTLSGLYAKEGFEVDRIDPWNEENRTHSWVYDPIDTAHSHHGVNASEEIKTRYTAGKPDIIYRSLKEKA